MQLFHYTDASAVKAILEFGKMRLTDMRFLNDSEEVSHATKMLLADLQNGTFLHRLSEDYAETSSAHVLNGLSGLLENKFSGHPLYSMSFSAAPDLLSQWRSYGSYAIEISKDKWDVFLTRCIYDDKEAKSRLFSKAVEALREIGRDQRTYAGELKFRGAESYMDLVKVLASIKHSGFAEEKEWRLLLDSRSEHADVVQYRVRSDMLIPFIEVELPLECVDAIHVGPMRYQDMAYESMLEYAQQLGHLRSLEKAIKVVKSPIPYRPA
ncbi:hypothetical protein M2396_000679 [Pseudomonas sp. BIGb0278]|uniref:DUF2971 domain-containing protein n=1 Tax=Pseudomonas sp. BIGb0278 TaxID=2940607 RepID=UPI002167A848|nr:DUF2971 domain-containing protein [Pseudomonas sp. BIGb0278]MCS4282414.1 hypothetical protein [Pseudomonas sp. BIGb0278]